MDSIINYPNRTYRMQPQLWTPFDDSGVGLLSGESDGLGINAAVEKGKVGVKVSSSVTVNNVPLNGFTFDDASLAAITGSSIVQGSTSPKFVHHSDGTVRSTPHNLFKQSQTLDNAAWTKTRSNIFADSGTTNAPDGTATAEKFEDDTTAASSHFLIDTTHTPVVGQTYNVSIYAKTAGQSRYLQLAGFGLPGASECPNFNLDAGTVDTPGSTTIFKSATMTSVGNGWYRCSAVIVAGVATGATFALADDSSNNALDSYNGDNASGIFLWGAQLSQGAYLHPYKATTTTAWYGVPQGYDNAAAKFGLLIEPAATNLILRSEALDNASWTKTKSSISADATTAPDGSPTADRITEDGTSGSHGPSQTLTISANTNYVISMYVKAGSSNNRRWVIGLDEADFAGGANSGAFNPATGVFDTATAVYGSGATAVSRSVEALANGWYRVSFVAEVNDTAAQLSLQMEDGAGNSVYTGDTTSNILIWGIQFELASATMTLPTSYIPTLGSTVTRAVDEVTLATSTFPYADGPGTVYVDFKQRNNTNDRWIWELSKDATNAIGQGIPNAGGASGPFAYYEVAGSGAFPADSGVATPINTRHQHTHGFATNDIDVSSNGTAVVSNGSQALPTGITSLKFPGTGVSTASFNPFNGFIYRFIYVPVQVQTRGSNLATWRYNF